MSSTSTVAASLSAQSVAPNLKRASRNHKLPDFANVNFINTNMPNARYTAIPNNRVESAATDLATNADRHKGLPPHRNDGSGGEFRTRSPHRITYEDSRAPTLVDAHPNANINHRLNTTGALIPEAWAELLPPDLPDREFILKGVNEGFFIVNKNSNFSEKIRCENYRSATDPVVKPAIEAQILEEISNGRYLVVSKPPDIISALGAVPKKGSDRWRLIHDCSRPEGRAINDMAENEYFAYQTLDEALGLIHHEAYMAKVDLASAYRSVKIHPDNYNLTGLAWTFADQNQESFLVDTRLPFGARLSPSIFNKLTQAVRSMMEVRGFQVVAYLDDFFCIADTLEECQRAKHTLLVLLRQLGFAINYNKLEGPARKLVFLGVGIDSTNMVLSLETSKIRELQADLRYIKNKTRASKRALQSLAGKLNWACRVIYGGRIFLRRILDVIKNLKKQGHSARISGEILLDIEWWLDYLEEFNGTMKILDDRPCSPVTIDACNHAAGGVFQSAFFHLPWSLWKGSEQHHINTKEVLALEPAAMLWAAKWENKKIYVHSDNQCAVAVINKGSSQNQDIMGSLRRVFWLSIKFNFRIKAVYYPGSSNTLADLASRLHEPGAGDRLYTLLTTTSRYGTGSGPVDQGGG